MTLPGSANVWHRHGLWKIVAYSEITINDKNFIKRYIQRKRLSDAFSALRKLDRNFAGRMLDFGGGDGEFCRRVSRKFPCAQIYFYEPAIALVEEALEKLKNLKNVTLISSLNGVSTTRFDYIFCLEVFEHLPDEQTLNALHAIDNLLDEEGIGVIGVPNGIFLPALFKGLFRMCRRYGDFDASIGNIWRAALGRPPQARPVAEISPSVPYHFQHLGFDYRVFRKLLTDLFCVQSIYGSPFTGLGIQFSSEVYFIVHKKEPTLRKDAETRQRSS
jgi:2-polyprenyl-3-methyl-5-hydroxy-6-metoxy-1,4-benzoquinol methylase